MDINEKAKEYAEGKALEAITNAIEGAYASGYKEGYQAGLDDREPEAFGDENEDVEYVDLNLPSGTLWSTDYLYDECSDYKYLAYNEAIKLNIPTKEQFEELRDYCEEFKYNNSFRYLGSNGNFLSIRFSKVIKADIADWNNDFWFWLKDEELGTCATSLNKDKVATVFTGYKMPVMLVKNKKKEQ